MEQPQPDPFLVLSEAALTGLGLTVFDIVTAIEQAILVEARGEILTSPKSGLSPGRGQGDPGDGRYMMTTLASGDAPNLTIVKSVMVSPRNPARGLPGVDGTILVQDSETGQLLAVMQAGWITAMRTAGLSGVAARRLASAQARTVAFVGAGVQARSHFAIFAALFPLTGISIYGRGKNNIDQLCAMARDKGLTVDICDTPRTAVAQADLIVSSISRFFDGAPFIDARWLKPGAFATIADLALPWIPDSLSAFDTVIVDSLAQERASPVKLVSPELVTGDLAGVLAQDAGRAASVAVDPAARRAFVFRGIAIGDFAVARLAWQRARGATAGKIANW